MSQNKTYKVKPSSSYHFLAKIVTLGDSTIGKSSLIMKFTEGSFIYSQLPTIGVDLKYKTIDVGSKRVKLEICDTAGQERFRRIATDTLKKVQGVILCYAVNDRGSFENIGKWIEQIKNSPSKDALIILVATKSDVDTNHSDLTAARCVPEAEGQALAAQYGVPFLETSAVDGTNVNEVFETIAKMALKINESIVVPQPQHEPEPKPDISEDNVCCLWGFLCPSKKMKEGVTSQKKVVGSIMMTSQERRLDKRFQSYEDQVLK